MRKILLHGNELGGKRKFFCKPTAGKGENAEKSPVHILFERTLIEFSLPTLVVQLNMDVNLFAFH